MAIELITGHSGEPHVSGDDVGRLLMGVVGAGSVMLGSAPSVTMTDANTCSIGACDFLLDGRHVRLTGSSVVSIANGATGSMRSDLVVARYAASASTGVESVTLEVIQGAAGSSATDPDLEYPASIADGATTADYPIVRVTLDGLNPTAEWLVAESLSLTDVVDRIGGIAPPPAVKVASVAYAVTSDNYHFTATAPTVSGYTFVCWVDFRCTVGYGVWKAVDYVATTTDVWPQLPPSVTTYPSDKKIICYALYMRNVGSMTYVAHG